MRLSPLEWKPEAKCFKQVLFKLDSETLLSKEHAIKLNDNLLQVLEALQSSPLASIRELAKSARIPLSTFHRMFREHQHKILVRGELSPEKLHATTLLCLKPGALEGTVDTLEKIIIPKDHAEKRALEYKEKGWQVWRITRVFHRLSAFTYQLIAKEGYPFSLWGFLFTEFLKGQRQATIFPPAPFEHPTSKTQIFNPFSQPEKVVTVLGDLRAANTSPHRDLLQTLIEQHLIQQYLAVPIAGFTEEALVIFSFERDLNMFNQTSQALLELPYIILFEGWNPDNQRVLMSWVTLEKGGVFQLQDQLSLLEFANGIRVFTG